MLAGKITDEVPIPHEPGQWVKFRTLSGRELDEAQAIERDKTLAQMKAMGQDLVTAIQGRDNAATPDPVDFYDKEALIKYGVAAWSYEQPCNDENKRQLDAETRDWAARTIVEMNTRTPGEATGSSTNSNGAGSHSTSGEPIDSLKVV